jgi:hypothetical protein
VYFHLLWQIVHVDEGTIVEALKFGMTEHQQFHFGAMNLERLE